MVENRDDVSIVCSAGMRKKNEDRACFIPLLRIGKIEYKCLSVMDGHGGHAVAAAIQTILTKETPASSPSFQQLFRQLDAEVVTETDACVGSTLTMVAAKAFEGYTQVTCASVGDSRAVLVIVRLSIDGLSHTTEVIPLSFDHRPVINVGDTMRIEAAGGRIVDGYIMAPHNCGMPQTIALSRAIGDRLFSGLVTCDPDVTTIDVMHDDNACYKTIFVTVCSDGVWDVLSNNDVAELVASNASSSTDECSRAIYDMAVGLHSRDNITACVWRLK